MELKRAEMMAIQLMTYHGLHDWHFKFDRAIYRLGLTSYTRKTISLSKSATLRDVEARVLNTILHEIAHALVSPGNHHNKVWRKKAIEIGCDGKTSTSVEEYNNEKVLFNRSW